MKKNWSVAGRLATCGTAARTSRTVRPVGGHIVPLELVQRTRLASAYLFPSTLALRISATMARRASAAQLQMPQIAKGLGRILVTAFPPFLAMISFLWFAGFASAQTAPDSVLAFVDSLGVHVTIIACQSDAFGADQTKTNCYNFGVYRNPPGFDKPVIGTAYLDNSSSIPFTDPGSSNLQVGQSYSYRVCTNIYPDNTASNCKTTNAVKIPPQTVEQPPTVTLSGDSPEIPYGSSTNLHWTSANAYKLNLQPSPGNVAVPSGSAQVTPGGTQTYTIIATASSGKTASASFSVNVFCPTPTFPKNVSAVGGPSGIQLKWTNPVTSAGQPCPVPSSQVLIYRMENNAMKQVAALSNAASHGTLPTHYTDSGPFQPHMGYLYLVCEVGVPNWQNPSNCSPLVEAVSWGADPMLTATRINGNTIRLRLNLDQNTVSSIVIARQGSDDACRQGQTLGNGLQGCPDNPVVLGQNTPVIYNWTASQQTPVAPGFDHPQTPPFVVDIPDDTTVHPAAEYWYQTAVVWLGSLEQDAAIVTVSDYATALAREGLADGIKPLKLNGGAPSSQSGSSVAAEPMARPMSRTITPAQSSTMKRPDGITTAPAAGQPVTTARPMIAPGAKATTPMLPPGQPMMGSPGASSAPTRPESATTTMPMMTPTTAPGAVSARVAGSASMQSATAASPAIGSGSTSAVRRVGVVPGGANLNIATEKIQVKPNDAQALYALGKIYCASQLKNSCLSYLYVALARAQNTGNAALVGQIKTSLAAPGVLNLRSPR